MTRTHNLSNIWYNRFSNNEIKELKLAWILNFEQHLEKIVLIHLIYELDLCRISFKRFEVMDFTLFSPKAKSMKYEHSNRPKIEN